MRAAQGFGRSDRFARELFRPLPARYDLAAELLSFGQNARWRRRMLDGIVEEAPRLTLDVATGTAGVALQLIDRTGSCVVGLDVSEEMIRRGRENAVRAGALESIDFVIGTAERLPFTDATFDALTCTYLFRYVPEPAVTLRELARVLKPGGKIASLEFSVPPDRLWRTVWWLYTRVVLPAAGLLLGRGWYRVGRFLGPSISAHLRRYPLEEQEREWIAAGIERIGCQPMSFGGGVVMWGTRSGS
jgi:demethylmenaquinone methyltransferase / 2-methoxy-6-polyprenyl-1,4-benzoquinol methylase